MKWIPPPPPLPQVGSVSERQCCGHSALLWVAGWVYLRHGRTRALLPGFPTVNLGSTGGTLTFTTNTKGQCRERMYTLPREDYHLNQALIYQDGHDPSFPGRTCGYVIIHYLSEQEGFLRQRHCYDWSSAQPSAESILVQHT